MPDLRQLIRLHGKYRSGSNDLAEEIKNKSKSLEAKVFNSHSSQEAIMAFSPDIARKFTPYFINRKKTEVALLYIDITNFSTKFKNLEPNKVGRLLDTYYDKVIPIIYENEGEIEKIIGDGIIAVFGEPFINVIKDFREFACVVFAQLCAGEIIKELKGTQIEVKIAEHFGEIMYYANNSTNYTDFTIVGNTLTELFRLESTSENNSINYFKSSTFHQYQNIFNQLYQPVEQDFPCKRNPYWKEHEAKDGFFKGVDKYQQFIQLEKYL